MVILIPSLLEYATFYGNVIKSVIPTDLVMFIAGTVFSEISSLLVETETTLSKSQ